MAPPGYKCLTQLQQAFLPHFSTACDLLFVQTPTTPFDETIRSVDFDELALERHRLTRKLLSTANSYEPIRTAAATFGRKVGVTSLACPPNLVKYPEYLIRNAVWERGGALYPMLADRKQDGRTYSGSSVKTSTGQYGAAG